MGNIESIIEDRMSSDVSDWVRTNSREVFNEPSIASDDQAINDVLTIFANAYHTQFSADYSPSQDGDGLELSKLRKYGPSIGKLVISALSKAPDLCGYIKHYLTEFSQHNQLASAA